MIEFEHPAILKKKLNLNIGEEGATDERLMKMCADTLRYSVKSGE